MPRYDRTVTLVDAAGNSINLGNPLTVSGGGGGGGGGACTIADGADVAEGATTDAAITSDSPGTVSGKLRGLVVILSSVWDRLNGRLKVDGSEVTQPVSAASLPLPSNAATETTLAAIKSDVDKIPASPSQEHVTAGSPSSVRLSDGSAFYKATTPGDIQPVSVADGADSAIGAIADLVVTGDTPGTVNGKLRGFAKIFFDVWDSVNHAFKVNLVSGSAGQADDSTFTEGTTSFTPVGGEFTSTPGSVTDGKAASVQITQKRALHANLRNASGNEIGTAGAPLRTDPTGVTSQPVSDGGGSLTVDDGGGSITVDASSWPLPTGAATESTLGNVLTQADFDTKIGSLTETAPTNDTDSSGLNGRLQRIAQRVTSLIALVPATLTALGNFKVAIQEAVSLVVKGTTAAGSPITDEPVLMAGENAGNVKLFHLNTLGGPVVEQGAAGTSAWKIATPTDLSASGSLTGVGQTVSMSLNGCATAEIVVTGTWVGLLFFEVSADNTNWNNAQTINTSGAQTNFASANGSFRVSVAGWSFIRARSSSLSSGTASVFIVASAGSNSFALDRPLPSGSNSIGSVSFTNFPSALTNLGTLTTTGDEVAALFSGRQTALFTITGTWIGTVVFETSVDGVTFIPVNVVTLVGGAILSSTTANGNFLMSLGGGGWGRVRASGWVSGTANILTSNTVGDSLVSIFNPLPTGANTIGSVTGTKTHNNAVPDGANLGVLPAIANVDMPNLTDTYAAALSVDLHGRLRVYDWAVRSELKNITELLLDIREELRRTRQ